MILLIGLDVFDFDHGGAEDGVTVGVAGAHSLGDDLFVAFSFFHHHGIVIVWVELGAWFGIDFGDF